MPGLEPFDRPAPTRDSDESFDNTQAITVGQKHAAALAHDTRPRGLFLRPHSFSSNTRPHEGGGWRLNRRQGTVGKEVRFRISHAPTAEHCRAKARTRRTCGTCADAICDGQRARHAAKVLARDMLSLCKSDSARGKREHVSGSRKEQAAPNSNPTAAERADAPQAAEAHEEGGAAMMRSEQVPQGQDAASAAQAAAAPQRKFTFVKASKVFEFLLAGRAPLARSAASYSPRACACACAALRATCKTQTENCRGALCC